MLFKKRIKNIVQTILRTILYCPIFNKGQKILEEIYLEIFPKAHDFFLREGQINEIKTLYYIKYTLISIIMCVY